VRTAQVTNNTDPIAVANTLQGLQLTEFFGDIAVRATATLSGQPVFLFVLSCSATKVLTGESTVSHNAVQHKWPK
jgi:hypothetical protein